MDPCLTLLRRASQRPNWRWPQSTLRTALRRFYIYAETPQLALERAVQRELTDLTERAREDLNGQSPKHAWVSDALKLLKAASATNTFPRDEFEALAARVQDPDDPAQQLIHWSKKHRALERRLRWLINPEVSRHQLQSLDPRADAQQLWCFVKYDFRPEFMHAAWANAIKRIAQDPPASTLIRATRKAEERPLLRTENTLYYHYFVMNWGLDSYHGRRAIEGLKAVHQPFHIPNEAMKFVALDAAFTVLDSLSVVGHRPLTETERHGYFHASVDLAQAMGVTGLNHDFTEMVHWFRQYNQERASYATHKRQLWDSISDSFDRTVGIPKPIASGRRALEVIAMDDDYRKSLGFAKPAKLKKQLGRAVIKGVAHLRRLLPLEPYVESLQPGLSYPQGIQIEDLVNQPKEEQRTGRCPITGKSVPSAPHAPTAAEHTAPVIEWEEIRRHDQPRDLWVVIRGEVYDLSSFAKTHPGGVQVLLAGAGTDMTEAFELADHSAETQTFMKNFRIGKAAGQQAVRERHQRGSKQCLDGSRVRNA